MSSNKRRLKNDPETQRHLFGRVRVDRAKERAIEAAKEAASNKKQRAASMRALKALIKARDKHPVGSPEWDRANRAAERHAQANGL
jgi:hypothetical protein